VPLFLATSVDFFTDSDENILDGNLELPQMLILSSAPENKSDIAFTT
jgi:hypothetical protein